MRLRMQSGSWVQRRLGRGRGNLSSGSDLLDSSQFLSALRHLCQGIPLHAGCGLCGLHPRVLRHGRVFHDVYGCVRHRLVLSALYRQLTGTEHPIPTESAWPLRGVRERVGASRSVSGYSYGYPYYYPWWGPWGYYGACCWGPAWGYGYGGFAAANVYGRWGNTAYANTRAAWANPYTGNYGGANRTTFQNSQRGTAGVAGRGANANLYTGNTVAGRGAVGYDPKTGIVAGGGAGFAGNMYSGQGAAGRGGFAYNTNTGGGVAAGANNVYAGKDGDVYRYNRETGNWSQNNGNGWKSASKPDSNLQRQQQSRSQVSSAPRTSEDPWVAVCAVAECVAAEAAEDSRTPI